jgi:hypothetical protein
VHYYKDIFHGLALTIDSYSADQEISYYGTKRLLLLQKPAILHFPKPVHMFVMMILWLFNGTVSSAVIM